MGSSSLTNELLLRHGPEAHLEGGVLRAHENARFWRFSESSVVSRGLARFAPGPTADAHTQIGAQGNLLRIDEVAMRAGVVLGAVQAIVVDEDTARPGDHPHALARRKRDREWLELGVRDPHGAAPAPARPWMGAFVWPSRASTVRIFSGAR